MKQKLIREVESICGTGEDAEYSFETMNELKYTHCALLEILRLHPPVPINMRCAVNSDTLPDGTRVPPGAGISLNYYALGRNTEIWGQDAAELRPERFMGEKEPSSFKYPVFHAGPRACIGKPLAMMSMKLVLSMLLSSGIEFKDRDGHSGEYEMALTSSMTGSFPMEISRRKSS